MCDIYEFKTTQKFTQLYPGNACGRNWCIQTSYRKMGTWESTLDIAHCIKLAELYDVTLEILVNHNEKETGLTVPPKGKHMFGSATVRKRTNCYS